MVRRRWSVTLERTIRELQGEPCLALEEHPPPKQQIACTRSFGQPVTQLAPLVEAVSAFASRAAEKLRLQGGRAGQVLVFVQTSPFRPGKSYSRSVTVPLRRPSDRTTDLVAAAVRGLKAIYRPGYQLMKAGVMLLDLQDRQAEQGELDLDGEGSVADGLMTTIDGLNDRFGQGTIRVASAGRRVTRPAGMGCRWRVATDGWKAQVGSRKIF